MVMSQPAARRRLDNYAYLVKKYCAAAEGNTCGPDADLETIRAQAPLSVSAPWACESCASPVAAGSRKLPESAGRKCGPLALTATWLSTRDRFTCGWPSMDSEDESSAAAWRAGGGKGLGYGNSGSG
jgi:hypothetical protein